MSSSKNLHFAGHLDSRCFFSTVNPLFTSPSFGLGLTSLADNKMGTVGRTKLFEKSQENYKIEKKTLYNLISCVN